MISTYTSKLKQLQIGDLIAKIPIIQGGMGVGISSGKGGRCRYHFYCADRLR